MVIKTLLLSAVVGGVLYALLQTRRNIDFERGELRKATNRWEDEGGAPAPAATV